MTNVYFLHQIKHNKTTGNWDKGIVVKDAEGVDNFDMAKQGFHAYLGAYAYGNNADTDYVQCKVTNLSGVVMPNCDETWEEREYVPQETQGQGE